MKEKDHDSNRPPWSDGIVLFANYFEFSEADTFLWPQVQSRCLIYCRSGRGTIILNNDRIPVVPGDFFLTTWNHSIQYLPDPENPYWLCCVHVIPVFPEQQENYFVPFHFPLPQYPDYHLRRDEPLPGFETLFHAELPDNAPMVSLLKYIVSCYTRQCPESLLRQFVPMLIYELRNLRSPGGGTEPPPLELVVGEIDRHLEDHDILAWVEQRTGFSSTTLYRMIRRGCGMSPGRFIRKRKLRFAAELLSESRLSVAEVSKRLHFCDPFYFSRLFKQEFGFPPSACRRLPAAESTPRQRHSHSEESIRQKFDRVWRPAERK